MEIPCPFVALTLDLFLPTGFDHSEHCFSLASRTYVPLVNWFLQLWINLIFIRSNNWFWRSISNSNCMSDVIKMVSHRSSYRWMVSPLFRKRIESLQYNFLVILFHRPTKVLIVLTPVNLGGSCQSNLIWIIKTKRIKFSIVFDPFVIQFFKETF